MHQVTHPATKKWATKHRVDHGIDGRYFCPALSVFQIKIHLATHKKERSRVTGRACSALEKSCPYVCLEVGLLAEIFPTLRDRSANFLCFSSSNSCRSPHEASEDWDMPVIVFWSLIGNFDHPIGRCCQVVICIAETRPESQPCILDVSVDDVSADSAPHFVKVLLMCSLEDLNLYKTKIGTQGVQESAHVLPQSKMKKLDIAYSFQASVFPLVTTSSSTSSRCGSIA